MNDLIDEQAKILEQATYVNSYSPFIPWANSIGFKTHSFRYQEQHLSLRLAEDFIVNLGFTRNDIETECSMQSYFDDVGQTLLSFSDMEDNQQFQKIPLTKKAPLKLSLDSLIQNRRSIKQYTGDSVSLAYVTSIVKAGVGITGESEVSIGKQTSTSLSLKAAPSAGGLYPVELYIVSLNIDELEKGIYQYNSHEDCLVKIHQQETVHKLLNCFSVPEEAISIRRAGFICLLIGSAPKAMYKYGNRGLGFTLHEVGSISQNIHLAVASLGLGSVDCASYFSDEAHHVLHLDGLYKNLFHTVVIGVSQ
mgnify:CR=1 FL=1